MGIVELTSKNHEEVVGLFGVEITNYYFIVEDLVRNNYRREGFRVFGEYEEGVLKSILLNNFNNVTYYCPEDRSISIYEDILWKLTFSKLSGPSGLMEKFLPYVKVEEDTISYMGVIKNIKAKRRYEDLPIGIIKTEKEIAMQYDLLMSTEEYRDVLPSDKREYIEEEMKRLKDTTDRTAYFSIHGEMVSSCSTVREGEKSAIVIGVITNPKHRNKGYGSEALIGLFEMLLKEGKYPYLFYNNPIAREVYKNIGITEVCPWRVIYVK